MVDFSKIITMPDEEEMPMAAEKKVEYGTKPAQPEKKPEAKHLEQKPEQPRPAENKEEPDWMEILDKVRPGITVKHKMFGNGDVVWMDKAKKYIRVKFAVGEKQFLFPDAFVNGFLTLG